MNKIKNLIKASPVFAAVAGLLFAGVASAALLKVYTTTTGTADAKQSVTFDGLSDVDNVYTIGNSPAIAGNTYEDSDTLYNKSVTTAPIKFVTNQCMTGGGYCGWGEIHDEDGVNTSYWSTVTLDNKDENWVRKDNDTTQGVLTYELASDKFNYVFEATGLIPSKGYSLIYYADESNRFEDWGGNNPGKLIATFTTDSEGNIVSTSGSKNLSMNLPHVNDANIDEYDYCKTVEDGGTGDMYNMCHGAKVWLVPSSDYSSPELTVWNPENYLFETDLITYDDTDSDTVPLNMFEGQLNFFIKNVLDIALAPGEYKVKTEVQPVI
ncbi:MAG: hypothetical protein V1851_02895 [Patescibacteria group bacterium]